MVIVRCEKGHFFDRGENPVCPVCSAAVQSAQTAVTPPERIETDQQIPPPFIMDRGIIPPEPPLPAGFHPVVGWMVCIQGMNLGKSFPIYAGVNTVSEQNDAEVCLDGEYLGSFGSEGYLTFDNTCCKFTLFYNRSVEVNGLRASTRDEHGNTIVPIRNGDVITLNRIVKFKFIALCDPDFRWTDYLPPLLRSGYTMVGVPVAEPVRHPAPFVSPESEKQWQRECEEYGMLWQDDTVLSIHIPSTGQTIALQVLLGHQASQILRFLEENNLIPNHDYHRWNRFRELPGDDDKRVFDFPDGTLTLISGTYYM